MSLHHECFHIRKSADRSLFAAPRSLSQLVTSFFGSWCQGIHLMLLFAWTSFWIFFSCSLWIAWVSLNICFGFLFAVKRFDPFYVFSVRLRSFNLTFGNCSSLPKFFGKTYSNLFLFIKMCPLLSVRFYSFYFFIRFSMNIFFTVRILALF